MDVKEVREKKLDMVAKIKKAVTEFQAETNCHVQSIDLDIIQGNSEFGIVRRISDISVKVEV